MYKPITYIRDNFFKIASIFLTTIIFLFIFLIFGLKIKPSTLKETIIGNVTPRNVYLGFWTGGLWDNESKRINPEKLREIENKIGKEVAIANYFRGWEHLSVEAEINNELKTISENGWVPMISTNPYFFSKCKTLKHKNLYRSIADGECDVFLHEVGKNLSKLDSNFFLRFAWEMNVNTMDWSIQKTYSNPNDFIEAWRRIYRIFQLEGANKNIIWVYSPQVETPSTIDIAKLYPGDEYVDWVALDGYNWGSTKTWSKWTSFSGIFYKSYLKMKEIAPNKKFMIAEVNTVSVGGNQALWYKEMLSKEIPDVFTKIDAIIFFNEDKTKQEGVKWLIDSSEESLNELRNGLKNPIYKSTFE